MQAGARLSLPQTSPAAQASSSATASTLAFSPDQHWLVISSTDESSPTQVWDLVALRGELAKRGLDLPADVLRPADNAEMSGPLQVELDDAGIFGHSPAAK